MASVEQPLKKRKLNDSPPSNPPHSPPPPPPESTTPFHQNLPQPLSQEEILTKRRNKDAIRNLYEIYTRIKRCLIQKQAPSVIELGQNFHALIASSKGCISVQRIVADFIPRYARHSPTALEAAAKMVINMHNWSLALISNEEDSSGIAFETAKACIFGLADICFIASSVAPTSAVIRGIRSVVFQTVLTFFVALFEGEDVLKMIDKNFLNIQDNPEVFSELKQKILDEDDSLLAKLSKFHELCMLWVFFSCPKELLSACLELIGSTTKDGTSNEGQRFLSMVTTMLNDDEAVHLLGRANNEPKSCTDSIAEGIKDIEVGEKVIADDSHIAEAIRKSCLLMLVLNKDPSLRKWTRHRCKKLLDSLINASPETTSVLQGFLGMFAQQTEFEDCQADSDEDKSEEYESIAETSRKGLHFDNGGVSRTIGVEKGEEGNMPHVRCSTPRDSVSHQIFSPTVRTAGDFRSNSFEGRNDFPIVEKNQVSNVNFNSPLLRSSSGTASNVLASPNHHFMSPTALTKNQSVWFCDGDPACVDIIAASKQLWVGCVPPDMPESHIRFQIERFGPIEKFIFFPLKGFALVEYRRIIDAIKARHYAPGNFPCRVKFMDIGLGTRGAVNGVAVGSSSHIYVGNISSQWEKDEILHESRKVVYKGPLTVIDLSCESALLLEFETPEEATSVMLHLRQLRRERSNYNPHFGPGTVNVVSGHAYRDGARPLPAPAHLDLKVSNSAGSPQNYTMEFVSPRVNAENHSSGVHGAPMSQSNWQFPDSREISEVGGRKHDGYDNLSLNPHQGGNVPHVYSGTHGPSIPPPQQIQSSPFTRPVFVPPSGPWDPHAINNQLPANQFQTGVIQNNFHGSPFIPASETPVAQIQGTPMQPYNQQIPPSIVPPHLSSLPPPHPHSHLPSPPPLPQSQPPLVPPPPLPQSQPPLVPPPPCSPPPPHPPLPVQEPVKMEYSGQPLQYQWQGNLCKSGVSYCTIYACREDSSICRYLNAIPEPAEWPAKLDMNKRTDLRHVKSIFAATPSHRREVCRLIPSSTSDDRRFQDFVSYLKQRDCAGVIKIPASKSIWARLLFILPHSLEMCSLLSIAPDPSDCLIALVLPKETSSEWI